MRRLFLTSIALAACACASADFSDAPSVISYGCNSDTSAFSIVVEKQTNKPDAINSVAWRNLAKFTHPPKEFGIPFVRDGSKILVKKCGNLTLKFSYGYFNGNPNGRDGAIDFPVLEILQGSKKVLAPMRLAYCEVADDYANAPGDCPSKYAVSVTVDTINGLPSVTLKHRFSDANFAEQETFEKF